MVALAFSLCNRHVERDHETQAMTIFAVIQQPNATQRLPEMIGTVFPTAHYNLSNGVWLVSSPGTAKDVSDQLGITDGQSGAGVVIEAASYYGYANPAIWSWIKANWTAGANG